MRTIPLLFKHRIDKYPPKFFDRLSPEDEEKLDDLRDYITEGKTGRELERRHAACDSLETEGIVWTNRVNLLLALIDMTDEILDDDDDEEDEKKEPSVKSDDTKPTVNLAAEQDEKMPASKRQKVSLNLSDESSEEDMESQSDKDDDKAEDVGKADGVVSTHILELQKRIQEMRSQHEREMDRMNTERQHERILHERQVEAARQAAASEEQNRIQRGLDILQSQADWHNQTPSAIIRDATHLADATSDPQNLRINNPRR